MGRKYWVGSCNDNESKPTNFETYLVFNESELEDAQHDAAVWMADDYLGELEHENDESN